MKTAYLFPGQGSQYPGMGKSMYEASPVARQLFEEACDTLGFDIKRLCFEGDMRELSLTTNAQPAILTVSYIAFRLFMEKYGLWPKLVAGHSLGEYTALACAEAISFADALEIVHERGRLMQEAFMDRNSSLMIAIRGDNLDIDMIKQICEEVSSEHETAVISNDNSVRELVVSGHKHAVLKVEAQALKTGCYTIALKVSAPFHSPLMLPAAERLGEFIRVYAFRAPKWPIVSNVTALPYRQVDDLAQSLMNQMISVVRWRETMTYIRNQGIGTAIELGPKKILQNLSKENLSAGYVYAWDNPGDMDMFDQRFQGEGKALKQQFIAQCISTALCTRNRNLNNEEYEKHFITPYREALQLQRHIRERDGEPSLQEMQQAMNLLLSAFRVKRTLEEEQQKRLDELFYSTGVHIFGDRSKLDAATG